MLCSLIKFNLRSKLDKIVSNIITISMEKEVTQVTPYLCNNIMHSFDICLFVWVFCPNGEFFTHMETSTTSAANFNLYSALMGIEQLGLLRVQHLMWHGISLTNDHLRGLTHERLEVDQVFRLSSCSLLIFRSHEQKSRSNYCSLYKWIPLNLFWSLCL